MSFFDVIPSATAKQPAQGDELPPGQQESDIYSERFFSMIIQENETEILNL
jgi:hypothetical protein